MGRWLVVAIVLILAVIGCWEGVRWLSKRGQNDPPIHPPSAAAIRADRVRADQIALYAASLRSQFDKHALGRPLRLLSWTDLPTSKDVTEKIGPADYYFSDEVRNELEGIHSYEEELSYLTFKPGGIASVRGLIDSKRMEFRPVGLGETKNLSGAAALSALSDSTPHQVANAFNLYTFKFHDGVLEEIEYGWLCHLRVLKAGLSYGELCPLDGYEKDERTPLLPSKMGLWDRPSVIVRALEDGSVY